MIKNYLGVTDLDCYNTSFNLSNVIWDITLTWSYYAKNTVGMQLVRSIDSVSANIAEGFGRYGKKDKIRFYRISRGSLLESIDWIEKAKTRKLITI